MTKSKVSIILGLVAIVLLAIALFLIADDIIIMEGVFWGLPFHMAALYFLVSGISLLLLTVGLILMIKQRLYKGGVIVLFAGIAPLVMFFAVGGILSMSNEIIYDRYYFLLFSMLSSILAIISGSLAIKKSEEHKRDYRGLIIPITGLLFAIYPAFLFIHPYVIRRPFIDLMGVIIVAIIYAPLSIIATVLNIISMFKIRKETNPKAKFIAKILIGLTWSMIIIFVGLPFIWWLVPNLRP